MKRRCNADDRLRAAERAYYAEPSPETRVAYWKECVRANKLPAPSYIDSQGWPEWVVKEEEYAKACIYSGNTLKLNKYDMVGVMDAIDGANIIVYLDGQRTADIYRHKEVKKEVMKWLKKILERL